MMTFERLIAPISTDRFHAEVANRRPLHIPAQDADDRRDLLTWDAFNALLGQADIWTSQNLRLVMDRVAVPVGEYCQAVQGMAGQLMRPMPQKVDVYLGAGASLIANEVQTLHPPIARLAACLSETFAAQIGVNVYCSFKNIQAFGPHYDVHDVFAVQTEGEKLWRIYENQAENPVDLPPDSPETRQWLERSRGTVMQEIVMKPGDVLYIPRGQFHDAIALSGPSLHVTFSVTALYGRKLLSLLESAAMQFPLFRAYFPPADQDQGRALSRHLADVSRLVADILASPAFRDEVVMSQHRLAPRPVTFTLPERKASPVFRPGGQPFPKTTSINNIVYEWCGAQAEFSLAQALAEFDFVPPDQLRTAIEAAEAAQAIRRVG